MNDAELDATLKAARIPPMPANYTETFPQTVLNKVRSDFAAAAPRPRRLWLPQWGWGLAMTLCLLIAFTVGYWRGQSGNPQDVLANGKLVQETMAMFPNQVRAILADGHGVKLVLAEKPEVPASTPVYVRIRDGRQSTSLVTFSGQELQLAGQKVTILCDANGGIILEGSQFVWSSKERVYAGKKLVIEAKLLSQASM